MCADNISGILSITINTLTESNGVKSYYISNISPYIINYDITVNIQEKLIDPFLYINNVIVTDRAFQETILIKRLWLQIQSKYKNMNIKEKKIK